MQGSGTVPHSRLFYPCVETEARRGKVTCLKPQSRRQNLNPGLLAPMFGLYPPAQLTSLSAQSDLRLPGTGRGRRQAQQGPAGQRQGPSGPNRNVGMAGQRSLNRKQPSVRVNVTALDRSPGANKEDSLAVVQPWLRGEGRASVCSRERRPQALCHLRTVLSSTAQARPSLPTRDVYAEARRGEAISLRSQSKQRAEPGGTRGSHDARPLPSPPPEIPSQQGVRRTLFGMDP